MLNLACLLAIIPLWIYLVVVIARVLGDGVADALGIFIGPALYLGYALLLAPNLPNI